ncbi:MAG: hypothetical protein RR304_02680 [Bacteroides sp.]
MKKFNLSKIMKRAHNLYNNARAKYPTFSEALKKSWKMAKFDAMIAANRPAMEVEAKANEEAEQERREQTAIRSILFNAQLKADRIKREAESKAERMRGEIAARKEGISYNEYQDRLSRAMGYGCGHYCGD